MLKKINILKQQAVEEIAQSEDLKILDKVFRKYLGRKGKISFILKKLRNMPQKERAQVGREINQIKSFLEKIIEERAKQLKKIQNDQLNKKRLDVTVPGILPNYGSLHPITQAQRKIKDIFQSMGFEIIEGQEIENDYYNFDALNVPANHPAREMHDSFYLKLSPINLAGKGIFKWLLRTHTSPIQVRYMERNNPPLRLISYGRCFRRDATDPSHDIQFYQLEGLMVGVDVNIAHFKAVIKEFFQEFFNKEIKIRLRPSYFPFTEPSFEVDMSCIVCQGKGCSTCSQTGWLEMMGAGMVHPNVFLAAGYNPRYWQGFAFGIGIDRLVMMKYKINDIRLFYSSDLRFLKQF